MKTNSRIIILLAGIAVSAGTVATAYAQNTGNMSPGQGNMQNCEPGEGSCGENMERGMRGRHMASGERRHGADGWGRHHRGENAERRFQKADTDNSGTVSLEEFVAVSGIDITTADANSDGNVTVDELTDTMMREMMKRRAERAIRRFDTDGDGQASAAEIERLRQQRFARIDIDGSGAIEQDEMQLRRGGDRDGYRGRHRGDRDGHGPRMKHRY